MPTVDELSTNEVADANALDQRYRALQAELVRLFDAPVRDGAAIDRTMALIDATHAQLKALQARPGDPQRY